MDITQYAVYSGYDLYMVQDCLTPSPTTSPSISNLPSISISPTGLYPLLIVSGKRCYYDKYLGIDLTVDECAKAAIVEAECGGTEIWFRNSARTTCYCCKQYSTCTNPSYFVTQEEYDQIYQYEKCPTTTPSISISPTDVPPKLTYENRRCNQYTYMFYGMTVNECAAAAKLKPDKCVGNEIMVDKNTGKCYCCGEAKVCPTPAESYQYSSNVYYDLYQYKECPTTMPSISMLPTRIPSTSHIPTITASPTPRFPRLRKANARCDKFAKYLGSGMSIAACVAAAEEHSNCDGNEVVISQNTNKVCYCCSKPPICHPDPSDATHYWTPASYDVYEYKYCPSNQPSSSKFPSSTPSTSIVPTGYYPRLKLEKAWCSRYTKLGDSDIADVNACVLAALGNTEACTGSLIMWGTSYKFCGCCPYMSSCPDTSSVGGHAVMDLYEYRDCPESPNNNPTVSPKDDPTSSRTTSPVDNSSDSPSFSPTDDFTSKPTTTPTSSPINIPTTNPTNDPTTSHTKSPTKKTSSCAKANKRAKSCGATNGPESCCPGFVCHEIQTWRCVEGKIYL